MFQSLSKRSGTIEIHSLWLRAGPASGLAGTKMFEGFGGSLGVRVNGKTLVVV
jgi:hypothetical protein